MGKASILLVAGYSLLMLMSGALLSGVSTQAYDNAIGYYEGAVVRNIAVAGANMAANYLFLNPPLINGNPWFPGYATPIQFAGGSFTVTVDSTSSLDPLTGDKRLTLLATGNYRDSTYSVRVIMRPSNFAKFAVYAGPSAANAYWETGDSALGPVHTQGQLKTTGRPYFGGKVTTKNGVDSTSFGASHPIFNAGLESGVSIPLNKSYRRLADKAADDGKLFTGSGDLYLNFKGDSIMWHREGNPDTTSYLPTFAPNGAIVMGAGTGDIYMQGTVNGRYTVGSLDSTGHSGSGSFPYHGHAPERGRVLITGDLKYATNPLTSVGATDMLGIVAWNDINIVDNGAAQFNIQASMFSYKLGITVENYNSRPPGQLQTLGGWIVENIYATSNGIPLGSGGSRGYKCRILFDERFRTSSPPYFPTTGAYEILAWYE